VVVNTPALAAAKVAALLMLASSSVTGSWVTSSW